MLSGAMEGVKMERCIKKVGKSGKRLGKMRIK